MQTMFFPHIKGDAVGHEICAEIADEDATLGVNFDMIWDVWGSDGKHMGKAYLVSEDMLEYVHEAIAAGGIGPMEGRHYTAWED